METNKEKSDDFADYYRGIVMQEVIKDSKLLNEKIKQTAEYKKYLNTKKTLYDNIELCNRLKEFRRRNYELQHRDGINALEEISNLVRENDELLHNEVVVEFNLAEQRICKMMQQMFNAISEGLEFDFLNE